MDNNGTDPNPAPSFGFLESVETFMRAAGQLDAIGLPPEVKDPLRVLRRHLLADAGAGGVGEYLNGEFVNDPVEIADGLLDIVFVAWGTLLSYFGPTVAHELAEEVSRANLSKVGPDMAKDEHGKVMKPKSYQAPRIREVLGSHGLLFGFERSDITYVAFENADGSGVSHATFQDAQASENPCE